MNFVAEMFWNKMVYYTSSRCFTPKFLSWNSVCKSKLIFQSELRDWFNKTQPAEETLIKKRERKLRRGVNWRGVFKQADMQLDLVAYI